MSTLSSVLQHAFLLMLVLAAIPAAPSCQSPSHQAKHPAPDVSGFLDSQRHWYRIRDEERVISPLPNQVQCDTTDIVCIADNILLYQKANGGWPKNYDMLAVLTDEQRSALALSVNDINTTFDNGATHAHVDYLAHAYTITGDERYRSSCERGLDFIFSAQYPCGGWPQFYPDTSGYRKYITFNDGAMVGVLRVLLSIDLDKEHYRFLDRERREKARRALAKGLDCLLTCQVTRNGKRTAWAQQHDNMDHSPRWARSYEPAALTSMESAQIVSFLMEIPNPGSEIIQAVEDAVAWLQSSKIAGTRVAEVSAPATDFQFHSSAIDLVVVNDPGAPPIWARFYDLKTNRPVFCNRDGILVDSLSQVDRERRTGYAWYTYEPAQVLEKYAGWKKAILTQSAP